MDGVGRVGVGELRCWILCNVSLHQLCGKPPLPLPINLALLKEVNRFGFQRKSRKEKVCMSLPVPLRGVSQQGEIVCDISIKKKRCQSSYRAWREMGWPSGHPVLIDSVWGLTQKPDNLF